MPTAFPDSSPEVSQNDDSPEVSIVVPVYFNAGSLIELHRRFGQAMATARVSSWDVTFVDDGSGDDSPAILEDLRRTHPGVRVVRLSRNFGSIAAIQAGLALARGRCVAVIAADLQDPPEALVEMIRRWRLGDEVVLATRGSREDPWLSRLFSYLFYRAFRVLVSAEMPQGGFDFFLVDRKVGRVLVDCAEKNANLAASVLWVGFKRSVLTYRRAARAHGKSMWTFWKKIKYMYDSLLSYSYVPLRIISALGLCGMISSLGYASWITVHRLGGSPEPPGWASLMVVTLFFDGFLLTAIGLVGEYVWRAFDSARRRPNYILADCREPASAAVAHVASFEDPRRPVETQ